MAVSSEVVMKLTANEAQAVQGLLRLVEAQRKTEEGVKKNKNANDGLSKTLGGMIPTWQSLALTAGSAITSMLSISKVIELVKQYDEYLGRVTTRMTEAGDAAISLSSLQAPGEESKVLQQVAAAGAEHGVRPAEAYPIYQEAQSTMPDAEMRLRYAEATFLMMQLGTAMADALTAVNLSTNAKGEPLTPEEASGLIFEAAKSSKLSTAEFAKSASAVPTYSDPFIGAAAVSTLTQTPELEKDQIATYAVRGALALQTESELTKNVAKKLKKDTGEEWDDLDEIQRLEAIKKYVPDTSLAGLQEAGMTEMREARAVSIWISKLDFMKELDAKLREMDLSTATAEEVERLKQVPELQPKYLAREQQASIEYAQQYGPDAQKSMERQQELARKGAELQDMGLGAFVDEKGQPSWAGRKIHWILHMMAYGGQYSVVPGLGGVPYTPPPEPSYESASSSLKYLRESTTAQAESQRALAEAIKENTAALRDASGAPAATATTQATPTTTVAPPPPRLDAQVE